MLKRSIYTGLVSRGKTGPPRSFRSDSGVCRSRHTLLQQQKAPEESASLCSHTIPAFQPLSPCFCLSTTSNTKSFSSLLQLPEKAKSILFRSPLVHPPSLPLCLSFSLYPSLFRADSTGLLLTLPSFFFFLSFSNSPFHSSLPLPLFSLSFSLCCYYPPQPPTTLLSLSLSLSSSISCLLSCPRLARLSLDAMGFSKTKLFLWVSCSALEACLYCSPFCLDSDGMCKRHREKDRQMGGVGGT